MPKTKTLLAALLCLLVAPAAASAATTLGPVNPNPEPKTSQAINWPDGTLLFTAVTPAGVQLAAPSNGVVTRWTLYTDAVGAESTVQLRTLMPGASNIYTAVSSGSVETVAAVTPTGSEVHNVFHTFPARVPIHTGEIVGVTIHHPSGGGHFFEPVLPVGAGWKYGCLGCLAQAPADGNSAEASLVNEQWVALNAEVEPDVDGDGYGDETQDTCVGACAPVVPISTVLPPATKKKCKKGKKLKRGKCVKKKKKHHKPKK